MKNKPRYITDNKHFTVVKVVKLRQRLQKSVEEHFRLSQKQQTPMMRMEEVEKWYTQALLGNIHVREVKNVVMIGSTIHYSVVYKKPVNRIYCTLSLDNNQTQ